MVRNLSLLGFPFISGFYRKHIILERFYSLNNRFLIALGFLVGVGSTTAYRVKIINIATFGKDSPVPSSLAAGGFRWQLKVPMTILGTFSILRGFTLSRLLNYDLVRSVLIIDKIFPLFMIFTGLILGLLVRNLKMPFLRSM